MSSTLIRVFVAQLLDACCLMRRNNICHCDLKPENILLASASHPLIKVIDFGSACYENHTSFSYIQSRFYRAPEVLLGLGYGMDIDMWSVGCILAELYLGLPLFAGTSELAQLRLISECLGPFPSHMLLAGSKVRRFFNVVDGLHFELKTDAEYFAENNLPPRKPNRRYFEFSSLEQLVLRYPTPCPPGDAAARAARECFASLLSGLLKADPAERLSPVQAARHPFVTGEPWDGKWRPPRRALSALLDRRSSDAADAAAAAALGSSPSAGLPFPTFATRHPDASSSSSNNNNNSSFSNVSSSNNSLIEDEDDAAVAAMTASMAAVSIPGIPNRSRPMNVPSQPQQQQQRSNKQPMLGMTPSERKHK